MFPFEPILRSEVMKTRQVLFAGGIVFLASTFVAYADLLPRAVCVTKPCTGWVVSTFSCEWDAENLNCLGGEGTCEWCQGTVTSSWCKKNNEYDCELLTGASVCGAKFIGTCSWNPANGKCICSSSGVPTGNNCNLRNCIDI